MYKKTLIIVSIFFAILCVSTLSFATTNAENSVSNVANTVTDGAKNLGSDVRNGIGTAENAIEGSVRDTTMANGAITDGATGGYTATRTATDGGATATTTTANTTRNTTMTWIWIVMAVAAIVIIALVWYYASQSNGRD